MLLMTWRALCMSPYMVEEMSQHGYLGGSKFNGADKRNKAKKSRVRAAPR